MYLLLQYAMGPSSRKENLHGDKVFPKLLMVSVVKYMSILTVILSNKNHVDINVSPFYSRFTRINLIPSYVPSDEAPTHSIQCFTMKHVGIHILY